jgi:glycosyltransferase involved in cell wall biosynthesis
LSKYHLLFVMSNANIGGPQKSLLALLDNIDYSLFSVDLYIVDPHGPMISFYNKKVKILPSDTLLFAASLPRKKIFHSLATMIVKGKIAMALSAIWSIQKVFWGFSRMTIERQHFWATYQFEIPPIIGEYDAAFGILGLSTYIIIDKITAKKKYHWIRSDTRVLGHDESIDAQYYKKLDGALSVSYECSKIFEDIFPFIRGRIYTLYNLIPTEFYKKISRDNKINILEEKGVKIVTVTRLDPLKGLELAVEACRLLIQWGYNITWFVLGDGRHRKIIEKEIEEKKLKNNFKLLGFNMNTFAIISQADIFVHPSLTEGKSNAVDEAKYLGKPIVITDYPTSKEQIKNGFDGLICGIDSNSIARSVAMLIDNPDLARMYSENCISAFP